MGTRLDRIQIAGYKSIREMDLKLGDFNVLIGANGAGKSNFVSFFDLVKAHRSGELQFYVAKKGGADTLLFYGTKTTPSCSVALYVSKDTEAARCKFVLESTDDNQLICFGEMFTLVDPISTKNQRDKKKSELQDENIIKGIQRVISDPYNIDKWRVYQFHDTTPSAEVRRPCYLEDNEYLQKNAGNLAAFLFALKKNHEDNYKRIVSMIQLVAPFFGDFVLAPSKLNPNNITLRWREKGSEVIFGPHQLSDGTLRMMALITLLLQPNLPSLIIIDEPELGLHPYALGILADLLQVASKQTQIILSTQSISLVNYFDIEDLVVVERKGGQSTFERKDRKDFEVWLQQDYGAGDLWDMNLFGGRPS